MRALKPAESRTLAWLLALLALLLAYFVLLHWWFVAPQLDISRQMRDLRQQQQRFAAIVAQRDTLQQRLSGLAQGQAQSSAFLPEQDINAASVDLMQRAVDAASHATSGACQVTQKMPVAVTPNQQPYRKVSANITMQCSTPALAAALYHLEKGMPYLFIDNFSVYRNPVADNAGAPPLQVQMTLSGYLRNAAMDAP